MKTLYKELGVICDVQKDKNCWGEDSVVLSMNDYLSKGHQIFRKDGWVIGKKDICPYCSKGISQFDVKSKNMDI